MTETEDGARAFVEEIISTALILFKAVIYFGGSDIPENAIKGIAAIRCAFTSGFDQSYLLILSAWYFLAEFGESALLINALNQLYPHICTCTQDSITIQGWMGVDTTDRAKVEKLKALDTCSEGAAFHKKKNEYRNYMNQLFAATSPDWAKAATEIIENTDTNFDGLVSAAEFAEALFLGFDINPNAEDREWVENALIELCGQYNTDSTAGLNNAQMQNCLSNKGAKIWQGAEEWAAERTANTYDPAIWDTILANSDADADGQVSAREGADAIAAYFGINLTTDMRYELENELSQTGGQYDVDGVSGLSPSELVTFLKAYGRDIWTQAKFLQKAQS